jgi:hypothetical protein
LRSEQREFEFGRAIDKAKHEKCSRP